MGRFKPTKENISDAVDVLKTVGVINACGEYPEAFGSYPSSFAATVTQCGLWTALKIYEDEKSASQANRERFPEAVRLYLQKQHVGNGQNARLSEQVVAAGNGGRHLIETHIMNAAVALKIALRMFAPSKTVKAKAYDAFPPQRHTNEPRRESSANIGRQFYCGVGVPRFNVQQANAAVTVTGSVLETLSAAGFSVLRMSVQPPGLLIGGGLAHGLPDSKDDVKAGLQFDFTSGLPVIPGSSVKGVIRNAFQDVEYIRSIFAGFGENGKTAYDLSASEIDSLMRNMFEYGDVFSDALVTGFRNRILEEDYITPHTGGPLAQPVPIKIVKVASGVTFSFFFKFRQFTINGKTVAAPDKLELCRTILEDFGIGAKTNVGYGVLRHI